MYRYLKTVPLILLIFFTQSACKSGPKFADVVNKDWKLIEVHIASKDIGFDRGVLEEEGFGEIFTLRFDGSEQRVNGVAAPNRYFAPYTVADKQEISISTMAGTLMAALHAPEKLKEQDYFTYLQNTYKWNLADGKLELYTKTEDGAEAVLFYITTEKK